MSKQRTTVIALTLAGLCGFGVYKAGQTLLSDEIQGTQHAVNQVWIDHVPRDDRDMIAHMVLIDHSQGQFGALGRSSQWRHMVDVFKWKLNGPNLAVFFPQERARGKVKVETWECEGEAPAPFELCMRLSNKGESAMLYSRHDWKVEPHAVTDSLDEIVEDTPALAGHLPSFDEDEAEQLGAFGLEHEAGNWRERDLF